MSQPATESPLVRRLRFLEKQALCSDCSAEIDDWVEENILHGSEFVTLQNIAIKKLFKLKIEERYVVLGIWLGGILLTIEILIRLWLQPPWNGIDVFLDLDIDV